MNFRAKLKSLKNKLWFNIFLQVAVIFAVFVAILMLCNTALLSKFFCLRQKNALISQINRLDNIDISDSSAVSEVLTDIRENYNFDTEIYDRRGNIKYTTGGAQMMDFLMNGHSNFIMSHESLVTVKTENLSNGIVYEEAVRRFDNSEFLLCRKEIDSGFYAEVKIQKQLVMSSAKTANEFITVVSVLCLGLSMIWIVIFARRFSQPLAQMNTITRDMADLKLTAPLR